jgi:hypothetical protein
MKEKGKYKYIKSAGFMLNAMKDIKNYRGE